MRVLSLDEMEYVAGGDGGQEGDESGASGFGDGGFGDGGVGDGGGGEMLAVSAPNEITVPGQPYVQASSQVGIYFVNYCSNGAEEIYANINGKRVKLGNFIISSVSQTSPSITSQISATPSVSTTTSSITTTLTRIGGGPCGRGNR